MKPIDTGKKMEAQSLPHGCKVYYAGSKPYMKKRVSKKRRRQDHKETSI
jgi:hypothetical protein